MSCMLHRAALSLLPAAVAICQVQQPSALIVEAAQGTVLVRLGGVVGRQSARPAAQGDLLYDGDVVEVSNQASFYLLNERLFQKVRASAGRPGRALATGSSLAFTGLEATGPVPIAFPVLKSFRTRGDYGRVAPSRYIASKGGEPVRSALTTPDPALARAVAAAPAKLEDACPEPAARSTGPTRSIAIGLNGYPNESRMPPTLAAAHGDAQLFHQYASAAIRSVQPKLIGPMATPEELRRALCDALITNPGPELLLFIAAHASPDGIQTSSSDAPSATNVISFDEIAGLVARSTVKVTAFFDFCHAGLFARARSQTAHLRAAGLGGARFQALLATSTARPELAKEDVAGLRRGLFTQALLERCLFPPPGSIPPYVQPNQELSLSAIYEIIKSALRGQQTPGYAGNLGQSKLRVVVQPVKASALPLQFPAFGGLLAFQGQTPPVSPGDSAAAMDRADDVIGRYAAGEEFPPAKEEFLAAAKDLAGAPDTLGNEFRRAILMARGLAFEGTESAFRASRREAWKAIDLDPWQALPYNTLGIGLLEQGSLEEAATAFEDAIRIRPHWPFPHHNLALARAAQGRFRDAEQSYRNALAAGAFHSTVLGYVHHNLGVLYHRLNRRREARAEYRTALEIFADKKRRYDTRAQAAAEPEASALRGRAAVLAQRAAQTENALGALTELQGGRAGLDEARKLYASALQRDATLTEAHYNQARALARMGNYRDSLLHWDRALGVPRFWDPGTLERIRGWRAAAARCAESATACRPEMFTGPESRPQGWLGRH